MYYLKHFFYYSIFLITIHFSAYAEDKIIKIAFIGDSLTAGFGIAEENSYPLLIKQRLIKDKYIFQMSVDGISGSTSASALSRLKWQLRRKPDILFLALGANDGLRGLNHQSMYNNLAKTIELAEKNNTTVILAGMKSLPNYGAEYAQSFYGVFTTLKDKYSLIFVPFLLQGVAGVPELNIADGIHPNNEGHQIIADIVYPFIKEAFDKL